MTTSVNCGYPIWLDGENFTGLVGRTFDVSGSTMCNPTTTVVGTWAGVLPSASALFVQALSGMQVTVAPGYCVVPNVSSALQGSYRMGLLSQATLTLATSDPTNGRIDLILARVYDLGTSASTCDVEILTGTPSGTPAAPSIVGMNCIVLAQISVPAGASAPGTITDVRQFTCTPGGTLIITSAAQLAAFTNPYVGMRIYRRDLAVEQVFTQASGWVTLPQQVADSGWITWPYSSGWSSFTGSPGYRRIQIGTSNRIYLRGTMQQLGSLGLSAGVPIGTLPAGFRPVFDCFLPCITQYTTEAVARLGILASTGAATVQGPQTVQWIGLDGVSFEQGN